MAGDVQTVTAKFIADISQFQASMKELTADAKAAKASATELSTSLSASGAGMQSVGQNSSQAASGVREAGGSAREAGGGFMAMGGGILGTVMEVIQLVQMVGQAIGSMAAISDAAKASATAFTYLTGSVDKAQQELANLYNTSAAKNFGTQNIDNVAQHFAMLGKDANTTQKEIERVSDAVAAMGGTAQQITPVIESLHKIQAEGRVTTQEIDQLADEGIASWEAMANGMGVSVDEAKKRVKAGAVSGKEAYQDMMQGMIQYTGAAEDKSQSLGAEWQRLGENAGKAFGPIADLLAQDLEQINELFEGTSRLSDAFKSLGAAMSGFGGLTMSLPGHAEGITDSPVGHFATIGERGPETMYIPQGASIIPNGVNPLSALSSVGSASSMITNSVTNALTTQEITLHVQMVMPDGRKMAEQVIPHIAPMTRTLTGRRA